MAKHLDLCGQKFGRLTAVSVDRSSGKLLWKFLCDCGNEKIANGAMVKYGEIQSCGCLRKETTKQRKSVDLTGFRFGRLLVLSQIDERDKHGFVRWSCLCDCGKQTSASSAVLNKGAKQSCGCIRREMMRALGSSSKQENPISKTKEYRSSLRSRLRENPTHAMTERISSGLARALRLVGSFKKSPTFKLLGFTQNQLKDHIEKQFLPKMSWSNRCDWEIDHIIPISTATCEQDVIDLNQLSNLRPLWSIENNRKSARRHFLI